MFLPTVPERKPRTEWACHPVTFTSSFPIAPPGRLSRSRTVAAFCCRRGRWPSWRLLGAFLAGLAFLAAFGFGAATCARRCATRAFWVSAGRPWVGRCWFVLCSTWSFSVLLFGVIAGSSALLYKLGSRSGRGAQNRVRSGQTGSYSKRGRSNGICPPSRSMLSRARRGLGGVGNRRSWAVAHRRSCAGFWGRNANDSCVCCCDS
jgi:hypothetical protein